MSALLSTPMILGTRDQAPGTRHQCGILRDTLSSPEHLQEELFMEPTKTPVPREAIDAYNLCIHGHIDRRSFLDRVKKVAVSSAAAAAIVDQLMPNYASAQQVSPTDSRIKAEYATVPSPQGNGNIRGYLVRPANAGTNRLPAILVVHENRGLNPHIEDVARRLALEHFMAFAPDGLTSVGGYPRSEEHTCE